MYYMAFDPGKATGVATWRQDAGNPALSGLIPIFTGEMDRDAVHHFLHNTIGNRNGRPIAKAQVEWFTINERTIRTAVDYNALHLIGAIQHAAYIHGFPIEYSRPDQVKQVYPDEALRKAGWWHKSDHARDALRHLARLLTNEGLIDPKLFLL